MSILEKLLGRKKRTAAVIADEIANQRAALAEAQSRVATAQAARKAALDALDNAALKAAAESQAEAERDVELRQYAVAQLETAHVEQVEIEDREAFRREVANVEEEAAALRARIENDYPVYAAAIASLARDLSAFGRRHDALRKRGRELGEHVAISHPEECRRSPVRWSVYYPDPAGGGEIQCAADAAPRGLIRWVDGKPVPAAEGVRISKRGGDLPASLVRTLGDLPGLRDREPHFHRVGEPFAEAPETPLTRA